MPSTKHLKIKKQSSPTQQGLSYSVVIATYNRHSFLQKALKSVYSQTLPPYEVVVVDDGSSDTTSLIKKEYPNITYIYQDNQGVAAARNKAIQHTTTHWIAFLDDDDIWEATKQQKQMLLLDNSSFLWCYCDEQWYKNNKQINIPKKYHKPKNNTFVNHCSYCNIAPSGVVMHKKIFKDIGDFDETFKICEDFDLWLRVLQHYPLGYLDEKLLQKHSHQHNQLGFSPNIEHYRAKALQKHLNTPFANIVKKELIQKYTYLYKGAEKRNNPQADIYRKKLQKLTLHAITP